MFVGETRRYEGYWLPMDSVWTALGGKGCRELVLWKHMIHKYEFNLVWWDGVKKVVYESPKMFRVFVTMQKSKFCCTNRRLYRFDDLVKNVCPSCDKENESLQHITGCRDPIWQAIWRKSVQELALWAGATTSDIILLECALRYYLLCKTLCLISGN